MAKFFKVLLFIFFTLALVALSAVLVFFFITKDAKLDTAKLLSPNHNVIIVDENGNEVINASATNKNKSVDVKKLPDYCKNAFIASEDRTFYTHDGLNYKRMVKALFKNISARSFKEGASTISQQLIKNTHLSNDKTIKRKLNEIKLTKQLEKKFSKDEILEMYLNTIYFGHNCYGLQSAADFYFDKKAEELSLTESATLVGLLTSPNNFSPVKNPEKSLKRRNIVLKCMVECGFLSDTEYENAALRPLDEVKKNSGGKSSDYVHAVFDEIETRGINAYDLTCGCTIKTYLNPDLQSYIENLEYSCDNSAIITSRDGGVCAYKSTVSGAKRQPGSTIKPILVYAPAIEEKIISPITKIKDEKISFGGYSPENYDKKYHGDVSVNECVMQSYNVPAVKTLNNLTVEKAEKYFTRAGFTLENDEKNLALALGGMKYGLNLKELADLYSIFQNNGLYRPAAFIKEIISADGKTIYKRENYENRVFSEGTCSLMNEMLINTAREGTAKKLKSFDFDIAAKTGTCGNAEGNTDAYLIGYTSEHCVGVWLGDDKNERLQITGGGTSANIAKSIFARLYKNHKPQNLEVNLGTRQINIDAEDYDKNGKIILCDPLCPKLNIKTVKILKDTEPKETSSKFSHPTIQKPELKVENNAIKLRLCQTKYYAYMVNRYQNNNNTVIYDGKWQESILDEPTSGTYIYGVTPYYLYGDKKIYGEEILLPQVYISNGDAPQIKIPDIVHKDWYNL